MKIRCLLLTGSVAILQYTASQLSECVGLVQAHRLLDDPAATPPQTYYIDQEGQLQTVEDEERRKAQAAAEKQRKDKGEKLTQAKAGFKAQMEKLVAAWRELSEEQKVPFVAEATACNTK